MKYKIYYLSNPLTNEIRYVGQTIQPLKNRLKKHLTAKDKSHRVNWLKSLRTKGLEPNITLICETDNIQTSNELEQYYINKFKNNGYNLVNMTNGGDGSIGFKHSEESKNKMKIYAKKRVKNLDYLNTLSQKGKQIWENKTELERKNNILNQPKRKDIGQFNLNNELIKKYISLREIERELGYFRANIVPCIKGDFKQAYGFIWKYL